MKLKHSHLGHVTLSLGVLFAASVSGTPVFAQSATDFGNSILGVVPVAGTLQSPSETNGTLLSTDLETTGGVLIKVYEFEGEQGAPLSIDVMSEDFDAYLFLAGPGYDDVLTDDDSGGACNARLTVFLPGTGVYRVVAGSLAGEGGDFTLRLDGREHAEMQGECGGGGGDDYANEIAAIESNGFADVGSEVSGDLLIDGPSLFGGSPVTVWDVIGTPGQTVYIDLMSSEFDALLYVTGPDVAGFISDDDSGGACNSRVELTFSSDEPYRIAVSSLGEGQGGLYTLRLSEEALPTTPGPCS